MYKGSYYTFLKSKANPSRTDIAPVQIIRGQNSGTTQNPTPECSKTYNRRTKSVVE